MTLSRMPKTDGKKSVGGLSPEETRQWLAGYRKHSKIYAWGFFFVVLPIVFGIIWWSMGELNQEVFWSFGFFAFVFLALAVWTRRKSKRAWVGTVVGKHQKKVRVKSGNENISDSWEIRYFLEIQSEKGKKIKLRVSPDLFDYFQQGDRVCKIPGLDWPEKQQLTGSHRICMACGALVDHDAEACPRCRAKVLDHTTLCETAVAASKA